MLIKIGQFNNGLMSFLNVKELLIIRIYILRNSCGLLIGNCVLIRDNEIYINAELRLSISFSINSKNISSLKEQSFIVC